MAKVHLSISGSHTDGAGETVPIQMTASGEYREMGEKKYLTYPETDEEGKKIGTVTLKIEPKQVTMIKHGEVSAHLRFIPNETVPGQYQTPYGTIGLEVSTKMLTVGETKICFEYCLENDGEPLSAHKLEITWE